MSTIDNLGLIAKNITLFTRRFVEEVNVDLQTVKTVVEGQLVENISLTDHSLRELARMGHPYSRRNAHPPHSPDFMVHTRSGELLRGIFSSIAPASVSGGSLSGSVTVGLSRGVQHAVHIVYGTSRMIPRDVVRGSGEQQRDNVFRILQRGLHNAVISFSGDTRRV